MKLTKKELIEWRDKVAGDMKKAISNVEMSEYDRLNTLYQKLDKKIRRNK